MAAKEISWQELSVDRMGVFKVPTSLQLTRSRGPGIGCASRVCSAAFLEVETGTRLMVSKMSGILEDLDECKCILNELKLLQCMNHDNIVGIVDLYPPESPDFDYVYVVKGLMDSDLHRIIYSNQPLSNEHHQFFTYQALRGLLYLHSGNIVHGDLRPQWLLVNKNCDLKISGFENLVRRKCDAEDPSCVSPRADVACRWYNAPEKFLLNGHEVGPSQDVWAIGCILCELIGRKPVFTSSNLIDQIRKIWAILGTPSDEDLEWVSANSSARKFLDNMRRSRTKKQQWTSIYPTATVDSVALLEALLSFNPTRRIDASEALRMAYYGELHSPEDEPVADMMIDGRFMVSTPTKKLLQNHLYVECCRFHPDIEERDKDLLHSRGLDVLLQSDRALLPVMLTLHSEPANGVLDEHIEVSFTNLAGNVKASLRVDSSKSSLSEVRRSLREQFPNPVKLVLPNGEVLSHSQDSDTLAHILQTCGDRKR